MTISSKTRRIFLNLATVAAAAICLSLWSAANAAARPKELRIGFQKSSVNITLLKQRKGLEQRLPDVSSR